MVNLITFNKIAYRFVYIHLIALLILPNCLSRTSPSPSPYQIQPIIPNSQIPTAPPSSETWTAAEMAHLQKMWLGSLSPLPPNPSNRVADNPYAAALGHRLFFDTRLSANNQIACATCHIPELSFTDGQAAAHGTRPNPRHTMSLLGVAYSPWLLWDGRKDSLWSQALEPVENSDEQGATRLHAVHLLNRDDNYRQAYIKIFGDLPDLNDFTRFPDFGGPVEYPPYRQAWADMTEADQEIVTQIYVNLGKAIAAYERLLLPGPTRFDSYIQAVLIGDTMAAQEAMSGEEIAGLRLFIGEADCLRCHSGPLLTDFAFHNTGVPAGQTNPADRGRIDGLSRYRADPFQCSSSYNDGEQQNCKTIEQDSAPYTFKTPSLRNVADTPPYMHAGQFTTLEEVLTHYQQAPPAPQGESELVPLDLSEADLSAVVAFLRTLSGPPSTPPELLKPPVLEQ